MENKSIAVFIDAENIPSKYAKSIFDIASEYGEIVIKRIYGDWTQKNIQNWKDQIEQYSIIAMQQFNFIANKNSSDMYLITEIMSVFYEKKDIDIFVIVSSDSDYTSLIQKLKEAKKQVIGMGLKQAVKSYVNSFNEFFYLDKDNSKDKTIIDKEYIKDLINITETLIEEKGRAEYAQIRSNMNRKHANFTPQNFNFKNFRALVKELLPRMKQFKESNEKNIYFLEKVKG
ncbi:NYN domain-containing protein [Campylobacter insulaenigrae]|uniref:NYN domain-containing protein n=1 Tax=Campylobacter insulaenigrae TaxID=260714 RepID=A0ABY3G4P6_9BACT|nr:NYN domain-containing protein [Campylobacter insulaenigrae]MCR6571349.1 NYN domain-containing protein [Campylobacter insulaenigrae]MCR6572790.1 NYN domain-containing protein [Campylobacter insulaenigrae]MCR6574426.1 NYN domain-containing protein [Campylobacter insulaenigrae]MCR6575779.1 NYN domain-containing protein [Campylobacter insulaenigrae]MCR6577582.1 NYN domain-containing protein [Campylobacter insulaenigrae]